MKQVLITLVLLFSCKIEGANPDTHHTASSDMTAVRTIAPQSENDASHAYFLQLLDLALSQSSDKYGDYQILLSPDTSTQGRWFRMLKDNRYLDVIWAGSNLTREQDFTAIPVDLLGGILGVRTLIIRKQDRQVFLAIDSIEALSKLVACHGKHWPDTEILRNAGLPVMTVSSYEANFTMLERERCDYFPRGIHEAYSEIEQYHVLNGNRLAIFDELLIVYPFNMWFFVDQNNSVLAERLQFGLTQARNNGSLLQLMKQNPITAHLFPIEKWQDKKVITIENQQASLIDNPNAWWLLETFPFYSSGLNK
ncbi:hypothetical protein [Shewanella waksmanii]|uniref:hypothetical protein n=1 Tax=Shewanella waksmanii TaxID=213783 RepID=UPI003736B36F